MAEVGVIGQPPSLLPHPCCGLFFEIGRRQQILFCLGLRSDRLLERIEGTGAGAAIDAIAAYATEHCDL